MFGKPNQTLTTLTANPSRHGQNCVCTCVCVFTFGPVRKFASTVDAAALRSSPLCRGRWRDGRTPSAVHLVAGSMTSPVHAQIARSELVRPLVNASVERFSRANHVSTCILLQTSISHRLFGCIRSVSGSASYGVQGHSGNAGMQAYADAQQAHASSPVLSARCFCDFCPLALGHPCRGACIKSSTGVEVLHEYRVFTFSSPFSATWRYL